MKRIYAFILSMVMVISMASTAFAAELPSSGYKEIAASEREVTPRIKWNGTAWLTTSGFCTITTSNNIFDDDPLVESDGNNAGDVTIRVLNEKGQQVGSTKTVSPGSSVRLDMIPANSGTYRIQGKASVEGNYAFNID